MERDPRIDPRPGDVLNRDGVTRMVVNRRIYYWGFRVYYSRRIIGGWGAEIRALDCVWKRWARTAEVLERGE